MSPQATRPEGSSDPAPRERPRVALLGSRGIPARYGGFETFAEELSLRLVERGIDVTVFCESRGGGPAPGEWRGVRLEHVPARAPGPLRTLAFDLACLWRARRGFDLVYMLGYGSAVLCAIPRLFGRRVWINMDGLEWRRSKWSLAARLWLRAMEAAALRVADRAVFDNAALAAVVRGRWAPRAESVIEYGADVVDGPVDAAPLAAFELRPGDYYLVVCRFEPENHVREIVRAFRAGTSGKRLAVVTNTDVGTRYASETMECDDPRVRFLGPVYDGEALRSLRCNAYAYVHGHSVGGTNPSLLEAMGCGNTVLAHDNPFNRETLGGAGLFFAGEQELVRRFAELEASGDARRRSLGQAGRARVAERYSWGGVADRYEALIRAELGSPAGKPVRPLVSSPGSR